MVYDFLIDTYNTERLKILSVWSMFKDKDLSVRPNPTDKKGRNLLEQMIHQCMSENIWFCKMFSIDVKALPLPENETCLDFIKQYAKDSELRLNALREKDKNWWEEDVDFFDVKRSRTWIMTRRISHSAQHRGQLITMLRIMGRNVHSVYGPSAETGGLPQNNAKTIYAYPDIMSLIKGEESGGAKTVLPGTGDLPCTERPES